MDRCRFIEMTIFPVLAPILAGIISGVPRQLLEQITEIRLRAEKPLLVVTGEKDWFVASGGRPSNDMAEAYVCSREDLGVTLQLISRNSVYAFEQELKQGFFTVPGGHRIGLAGQAIMTGGELKALKNIGAMNIRLAREIYDAAAPVMPYVIGDDCRVLSTLIVGPPCSGKTTLLRDVVRQLSYGVPGLKLRGVQVGLVDERSEIAACKDGVPSADLGPRTDVLDGCPKATGMLMLIRSMGPRVVVTDEIGRQEDASAIREALHAGVSVIASVHGRDRHDIGGRPYIGEMIGQRIFDRYIIISDKPRIGTIEEIVAAKSGEVLYRRLNGVRECG